jgi:hypothetical protein
MQQTKCLQLQAYIPTKLIFKVFEKVMLVNLLNITYPSIGTMCVEEKINNRAIYQLRN